MTIKRQNFFAAPVGKVKTTLLGSDTSTPVVAGDQFARLSETSTPKDATAFTRG